MNLLTHSLTALSISTLSLAQLGIGESLVAAFLVTVLTLTASILLCVFSLSKLIAFSRLLVGASSLGIFPDDDSPFL
jgi:hypothetical protein